MKKYVPKSTEKFRAFLRVEQPGKEHCGSPFVCVDSDVHKVDAIDKNGMAVILGHHDFLFEPIPG